jgi:hypothetical protein
MLVRNFIYWGTTILSALFLLAGGAANLYRDDGTMQGLLSLGYPLYFATVLGVWKVLGSVVIVAPRLPLLKEWAYAGIAFDLTAATFSHLAMEHSVATVIVPAVLLGIAAMSWHLRPASRKLGAVNAIEGSVWTLFRIA